MEWALNEYTYRECCDQEVRACDDCECYECKRCEETNYTEASPLDSDVCKECYIDELNQRQDDERNI